jgi:hypothetical protein
MKATAIAAILLRAIFAVVPLLIIGLVALLVAGLTERGSPAAKRWDWLFYVTEAIVDWTWPGKDYGMHELWDDRAVQVEKNTGRAIGRSTRGLDDEPAPKRRARGKR